MGHALDLVLGAGGVVGHAWHAGVLAALAESGLDVRSADLVVGTSAGSVVGALVRAGVAPADLYARATGRPVSTDALSILEAAGIGAGTQPSAAMAGASNRGTRRTPAPAALGMLARSALAPWSFRPGLLAAGLLPRGRVDTRGISSMIGGLHRRWPDTTYICAVRLRDGARVVFGRDEGTAGVGLGEAVAASCAIPGYFTPVVIGDADFVDGGVHSPTNADVVPDRHRDGDALVVVSSPMSLDRAALRRPSADRLLRIAHRTTLVREVAGLRRRGRRVVTLQPGPDDLAVMGGTAGAMDPGRRVAVARRARETTLRRLESSRLQRALAPVLA